MGHEEIPLVFSVLVQYLFNLCAYPLEPLFSSRIIKGRFLVLVRRRFRVPWWVIPTHPPCAARVLGEWDSRCLIVQISFPLPYCPITLLFSCKWMCRWRIESSEARMRGAVPRLYSHSARDLLLPRGSLHHHSSLPAAPLSPPRTQLYFGLGASLGLCELPSLFVFILLLPLTLFHPIHKGQYRILNSSRFVFFASQPNYHSPQGAKLCVPLYF